MPARNERFVLPLLAIPLLLGWLVARYWLDRHRWPELIGCTVAIAVVTTLIGMNLFYQSFRLEYAAGFTLGLQLIVLLILWKKRPTPTPLSPLPRSHHWALVVMSVIVGLYANAQQIAYPDDDYWIHAPLQGLMRSGNFPPTNPYFSELPMNGHYGRDLGVATFSYLSGLDVFISQHLLTTLLQLSIVWLFYSAFRCSSSNSLTALIATAYIFFGINAGGRGGLVDTMQNNNALVHLYLAFLMLATVETWKRPSKTMALMGGLTLGSYAIVYETHFGLVFLTILGVTPILLARGLIDRRQAAAAVAILVISLPFALTQGGPLTDIVDRRLSNRQHSQAEQLSKGMQNQAQVLSIVFPKEKLFHILLESGEYQRVAEVYRLNTPLKLLYTPSQGRGYAPIWSWDVLRIHFLPLYLFPLSVWVLWRRGSLGGFFMGAFGTIAFLVPALVDFGPVYESEYFRWEFAAALGFAGALGLTVGHFIERTESGPYTVYHKERISLSPKGWRCLLIALLTLVNCWASLTFVQTRLSDSVSTDLKRWLIFPSTRSWLANHPVFEFYRLDYEAAAWLAERVRPGDRMLVNFREENNFSILYESTLTGLSGAQCVGHNLPLEQEAIGTTPFRRNPAAQLFWQEHRPEPLVQLEVDWLFYRTNINAETPIFPGATLIQRFQHHDQLRLIYKVDRTELPSLDREGLESTATVTGRFADPGVLRGGRVAELSLELQAPPDTAYSGVLELSTVRLSDGLVSTPMQNLLIRLDGETTEDGLFAETVPFIPPREEGEYRLETRFYPHQSDLVFGVDPSVIQSSFASLVDEVTLNSIRLESTLGDPTELQAPLDTLITPHVELDIPGDLPPQRDVLAGWAFYSLERQEFEIPPGSSLIKTDLTSSMSQPAFVTPSRVGRYQLYLCLSAETDHSHRIAVGVIDIIDEEPI